MAQNTDEEYLENIGNTRQENPARENIATTETTNVTTNKKTMEVLHNPNLHHKFKKLEEYCLDVLMIFLTETFGPFAESIREYFVEHKRAKVFEIRPCNLIKIKSIVHLRNEKQNSTRI